MEKDSYKFIVNLRRYVVIIWGLHCRKVFICKIFEDVMEHTENIFTNDELKTLRKLYEIYRDPTWFGTIEDYAHKRNSLELWQRFYKEAGKVCLNSGCGDIVKSREIILWPKEWIPKEKAYWNNLQNEEINPEFFEMLGRGFKSLNIGYVK